MHGIASRQQLGGVQSARQALEAASAKLTCGEEIRHPARGTEEHDAARAGPGPALPPLHILKYAMNVARFSYMLDIVRIVVDISSLSILDVQLFIVY